MSVLSASPLAEAEPDSVEPQMNEETIAVSPLIPTHWYNETFSNSIHHPLQKSRKHYFKGQLINNNKHKDIQERTSICKKE
jgi:hypothetical protein